MRAGFGGVCAVACALGWMGGPASARASDVEMEQGEGAAPEQAVAEKPAGWVERAAITTAVVDREPQDAVESLGNDHMEIYFFTELRGLEGQTVLHRWERDGQVVAEVPMQVGGPRWRTYSRKQLTPDALGSWKASVVDASGQVLDSRTFTFTEETIAEALPEATEMPQAVPAAPQP